MSFRDGLKRIKRRFKHGKKSSPMKTTSSNPDLSLLQGGNAHNSLCCSVTDLSSPTTSEPPAASSTLPRTNRKSKTSTPSEEQSRDFFLLNMHLKEGRDLLACDILSGSSDPYVKLRQGDKLLYKSRTIMKTLNPKWDERFELLLDNIKEPLKVKMYDYNRALSDDDMGETVLTVGNLSYKREEQLTLHLKRDNAYAGSIQLSVSLKGLSHTQKVEWEKEKNRYPRSDSKQRIKKQSWCGVLQVVLVKGWNLLAMDENGLSDPYVRIRLGDEKAKSKVRPKTLNPVWREAFQMHLYAADEKLHLAVYDRDINDKDDFIGRATVDLNTIPKETTCDMTVTLEEEAGSIQLLLTITATYGSQLVQSNLNIYKDDETKREELAKQYGWLHTPRKVSDVGWLQVKVFRAVGLSSADIGGKSDPFCTLQLVNAFAQTHTEYKTLDPQWNKIFWFEVKDIHSVLEVTIYDEDAKGKSLEFLGKISLPLLQITPQKRSWFQLKDQKLLGRSKGALQMECDIMYNNIRAAVRTFNPTEEKYVVPEPKFKPVLLKRNLDRLAKKSKILLNARAFVQSCFDWQYRSRSITAFVVSLFAVYSFEIWMLPFLLVCIFLVNLWMTSLSENELDTSDAYDVKDDDEEEDEEKERTNENSE